MIRSELMKTTLQFLGGATCCTSYTDIRRSVDGLLAIIIDCLYTASGLTSIYLFCGKRCDIIKDLMKEPDGFVLLYKRLNSNVQGRFRWPRAPE